MQLTHHDVPMTQYWDVPVDDELEEEQKQDSASEPLGKSKCELRYGPYHAPSWPVPNLDKKTSYIVPPSTSSLWDIPIDYRDVDTKDEWIPRDGRLPRLAVKEGFRTESVIKDFDFVTNPSLHFVSNHHAVPAVQWESLRLTVKTDKVQKTFSMDEILALRPRKELPVTLVSAFLRQAELHALRATSNQETSACCGNSSIGTQIYKGVWLRTLLKLVDIDKPSHKYWVVAKGADGYSISLPLSHCCNVASDILLAYVVNGEPLLPDHGYPVRLVVPGWVASYSVKWLQEISVTEYPDISPQLCLVPPQFPASGLNSTSTWLDYRMTAASLQCITTIPKHNHRIVLPRDLNATLKLGGYAFAGGGRRITRVEVSLDEGATWIDVQNIDGKELTTTQDHHWCWVWWQLKVRVEDVMHRSTICCRAWDSANNTQSEMPTWNHIGVGANHIYSLRLSPSQIDGEYALCIRHPISGNEGWMKSPANLPYAAGFGPLLHQAELVLTEPSPPADRMIVSSPQKNGGKFVVEIEGDFEAISIKSNQMDDVFEVRSNTGGDVPVDARQSLEQSVSSETLQRSSSQGDVCTGESALAPDGRVVVRLQQKTALSDDCILLDFALPSPDQALGLPIGQHVLLATRILVNNRSKRMSRPYTPVSSDQDKGRVLFVVKVYRSTSTYPVGGIMSQYLDQMRIGDSIEIRGPVGDFKYLDEGAYSIRDKTGYVKRINMVAGGSGITPIMQLAAHIIRHPEDPTEISLIYASRHESELLLRPVLDGWAELFPARFRVHYILSDSWPSGWEYSTGYVDALHFDKYLFPPDLDVLNVICGPPVFVLRGCVPDLAKIGHFHQRIYSF